MVPERVKTIVVHHGNAVYHYEVDESWRNSMTQQIATGQRLMFHKRNRLYVAPSKWIQDRFRDFAPSWYDSLSVVLPHWVPQIHGGEKALRNVRPRVIGDWRNPNKGSEVWRVIQRACQSEFEFCQLHGFDGDDINTEREDIYRRANIYLCLSLSEGAPFSVADAEAAGLRIVTTKVGNCYEFDPWIVDDRNDTDEVVAALQHAAGHERNKESFYKEFTMSVWRDMWAAVIKGIQNK
jgi:hypothetical protein